MKHTLRWLLVTLLVSSACSFIDRAGAGVTQVAAHHNHGIFLASDGTLWAMGDNDYGQLGLGTMSYGVYTPKVVRGDNNFTAVVTNALSASTAQQFFRLQSQ